MDFLARALVIASALGLAGWILWQDWSSRRIGRWAARALGVVGLITCMRPDLIIGPGNRPGPGMLVARALVIGVLTAGIALGIHRKAPAHLGFGDVRLALYLGPWMALGESAALWLAGLCLTMLALVTVAKIRGETTIAGAVALIGASGVNLIGAMVGG